MSDVTSDDLTHHAWFVLLGHLALAVNNAINNVGLHQITAVGNGCHGCSQLDWRNTDALAERDRGKVNFEPFFWLA